MLKTEDIVAAANALLNLRKDYSNPPKRERELDPLFYAFMKGHLGKLKVSRQHLVYFTGKSRPSRIDYRIGGTNPILLELAVRSPTGVQELMGPQNSKELKKLSKIPTSQAKRRVLLLLDLNAKSISKATLKASYGPLHVGPGKKPRLPVTIVYVHESMHYSFTWSPFK